MENFKFVDGHFVSQTFTCQCGREHAVPIQEILVRSGAIDEAGEVLNRLHVGKHGLVIADLNTYAAAGEKLMNVLQTASYTPKLCLFKTREIVKPNEQALGKVLLNLDRETTFLVAVGSGCLTDLTRYISVRTGIPFISVASAPSMDGYASPVASMWHEGCKKTVPAIYPQTIIADVDVICQAPYPMIAAGFGDLIGKLNSRVDWELSRIITGEYYCDRVVDLIDTTVRTCIDNAVRIRNREPEVLARLTEGLILSGIGMLLVGNSRPASGAEHHLSHYWDVKALLEHRPHHFHGAQVGVGTGVIAKFYQRFFSRNLQDIDLTVIEGQRKSPEAWEQNIRTCLEPIAEDVIELGKPFYLNWEEQKQQINTIQTAWDQIQALRAIAPTFDRIADLQRTVDGSIMPEEIDVDPSLLRESLLNAKEIRTHYTILRLADTLGWLEELTEEVVDEYN